MRTAYLFIRDDDVAASDISFKLFFKLMQELRIPVVYGVIPGRMSSALIKMLKSGKQEAPELIDIVQHGWRHCNYALSGRDKYEFGDSRSRQSQYQDLERGRLAMEKAFGAQMTPVFIPPFHGYNHDTLELMMELRFSGFSAGKKAVFRAGTLIDFPAELSLKPRDFDDLRQSCSQVLEGIIRRVVPGKLHGLLLHHQEFFDAGMFEVLVDFFKCMARWRDKGGIKIILLSDILRQKNLARVSSQEKPSVC